jgi:hypothetical protein
VSETGIVVLLVLLADVVTVAGLLLYGRHVERQLEAARSWGQADGVVTGSRLRHKGKGHFVPEVTYEYRVGGTPYTSRRLQFGGWEGGRKGAEALVAEHPAGTRVAPRYDPDKPSSAVLRVHGNPKMYRVAAALCGISFLVVAGLLYIVG